MAPRLHTVICSTRPGRKGPAIAGWFHRLAERRGLFDCRLVDLRDFDLPVYDEPEHPRLARYVHDHTKAWSASVAAADAFVFVTPEYNYAPPPSLANALTYVFHEWNYKPAGFVSYGGLYGGGRGTQTAKLTLTALRMVPLLEAVVLPRFTRQIDGEMNFAASEVQADAAGQMLDELLRWTQALAPLRAGKVWPA